MYKRQDGKGHAQPETVAAKSARPSVLDLSLIHIYHVLRLGGNTDRQRERVVAAFEKQKTTAEIAEILKTLYHGGNGLGSVSAWYRCV